MFTNKNASHFWNAKVAATSKLASYVAHTAVLLPERAQWPEVAIFIRKLHGKRVFELHMIYGSDNFQDCPILFTAMATDEKMNVTCFHISNQKFWNQHKKWAQFLENKQLQNQ